VHIAVDTFSLHDFGVLSKRGLLEQHELIRDFFSVLLGVGIKANKSQWFAVPTLDLSAKAEPGEAELAITCCCAPTTLVCFKHDYTKHPALRPGIPLKVVGRHGASQTTTHNHNIGELG
jgi:hypothetical protein